MRCFITQSEPSSDITLVKFRIHATACQVDIHRFCFFGTNNPFGVDYHRRDAIFITEFTLSAHSGCPFHQLKYHSMAFGIPSFKGVVGL